MSAGPEILELAMRSLPHGKEFRFVDRMISLTPGVEGVGEYHVRGDEYYLRGHLPGEPILPGVLLVESAAQVAGIVAQEDPANPRWPRLKLTALRAVKIFDAVRPGETLRLEGRVTGVLGDMIQAQVVAYVAARKVLAAELALSGNGPQKKMSPQAETSPRRFQFERDTFAFPHELVWKYHFDPATGAMTTYKADPPPAYYHRCFVLVRATRLFFDYVRFVPELSPVDTEMYRALVRKVIKSNPRLPCPAEKRIIIPGFDCLRAFSQTHEPVLKAECGAAWESYFLRSHWRMIFKVYGRFQEKMAEKLKHSLARRGVSLVHLFRFPRITINHGIVLYRFAETGELIEFTAYDPNIPEHPVVLVYEKKRRVFTFAPNIYWGGGVLSVMEIFTDFPY